MVKSAKESDTSASTLMLFEQFFLEINLQKFMNISRCHNVYWWWCSSSPFFYCCRYAELLKSVLGWAEILQRRRIGVEQQFPPHKYLLTSPAHPYIQCILPRSHTTQARRPTATTASDSTAWVIKKSRQISSVIIELDTNW